MLTSSDCKDIGIRQFEFVTKTHFLYSKTLGAIPTSNCEFQNIKFIHGFNLISYRPFQSLNFFFLLECMA